MKVHKNISRSLKRNRHIEVFYVYQDPLVAWEFTKARESLEGRKVPKKVFIDALFKAKKNVNLIKLDFGYKIQVNAILKNLENGEEQAYYDVEKVDSIVTIIYTKKLLLKKL